MDKRILAVVFPLYLVACSSETGMIGTDSTGTDVAEVKTGEVTPEAVVLPDLTPGDSGFDLVFAEVASDLAVPDLLDEPGPGEAGYPCESGDDCNDGLCIQTPDGRKCTITCQAECPFGWQCVLHTPSLPDQVFICAPTHVDLCRPCTQNADCMFNGTDSGQACLPYGGAGAFCGESCQNAADCPDDYACVSVLDVSGGQSDQCVLQAGQCGCAVWDIDAGAWTDCFVENDQGKCWGTRVCGATGLGACDAAIPVVESCNLKDDDCDGDVDEDTSGGTCLNSNEFGLCPGTFKCVAGELECQGKEPGKELCDGQDNDCDGNIDEGFEDTDGDGIADCLENDVDGDGIPDLQDNCPGQFNPSQADFDVDNFGDACDLDDDNDMTPDPQDCAPFNTKIHPQADEICDGADNNCNYLMDEGFPDTDFDGWKDCIDEDDDGDGHADGQDNCPLVPNLGQEDQDQDGAGDACDGDKDGDGVPDGQDNCPAIANPGQGDLDQDGLGDACDKDQDGDAIPDAVDNCPLKKNTQQSDIDDDGLGDVCDLDDDGDGVEDTDDNCPLVSNPGQADDDDDGLGNACEDDSDGDGTPDGQDCAPDNPGIAPGQPELCDGVDNNCNYLVDEGFPDTDNDDLKDCADVDDDNDGDPDDSDCQPLKPQIHHWAQELCNGIDDDCSQTVDDGLGTVSCGLGACQHAIDACKNGQWQVCNPFDGASAEACDGVDNDCDGVIDDDLGSTSCGLGQCLHTVPNCHLGKPQKCDPLEGALAEICDGLDNDCDGLIDEGLLTTTCGKGICLHTVANCLEGQPQECDPLTGALQETCDGVDNNCDGQVDEDQGEVTCGKGQCQHTQDYCQAGKIAVCDPFLGSAAETCDTLDNDCDGLVDEELGTTTCGLGVCEHTVNNCVEGVPQQCSPLDGSSQEVCDQLDNDCDGQIDPEGAQGCTLFYADADTDMYGLDGSEKCLCQATLQYSATVGGDCEDLEPDINPGEADDCSTQLDEDCSGQANDGCAYLSCLKVQLANPNATTGTYLLDPDGADGPKVSYEAWCDMDVDGGGWTLVAKVSGADVHQWGCKNQPGCSGSLWTSQSTHNASSPFSANEDAKYPAYMDVKGTDIMFYDVVHDYPLMYANDMYSARTLGAQVGQLAWQGGCTCCSEEYPVTWVKTGVAHVFCTTADCSNNPRIGWWCMDEEGWGSRDFNLIAMPYASNFDYNFGNKPGLASDRLDGGHGGGTSVDADGELGGTSDGRKWPFGAAIFVR